jgi:glycosyltransferase
MKVSIITVCYNRVATIEKAIRSVLEQNYSDIEYIVIDGNSTDGTQTVIEQYGHQLAKYVSEPDKGMYDAINKGLTLATGEIVGLVHSDDELFDTNVIAKIVEQFQENNAIHVVYGDGIYVSNSQPNQIVRNRIGGYFSIKKLKSGWLPLHPTVYIKRSEIQRLGNYSLDYKIASDTDFLLRYLYLHRLPVAYLNAYIIRMRVGGLSTSKSRAIEVLKEDYIIYKSFGLPAFKVVLQKKARTAFQYIHSKLSK